MKKISLVSIALINFQAHAQLLVDDFYSPNMLVPDVMLGEGVPYSNVMSNGNPGTYVLPSFGEFHCLHCAIQIEHGVLMSTGQVAIAEGPNNNTYANDPIEESGEDADLSSIAQDLQINELNDVTIIEFDFVAINDQLEFQIVWASEEYDSFANSAYNDICGIFLSGEGIDGPYQNNAINLALVPGTNLPITVKNINNGAGNEGPCQNCELYHQYMNNSYQSAFYWDPFFANTYYSQYNGWTSPINIQHTLVCGSTYHIKMAIADANDESGDSALFIREKLLTHDDEIEVISTLLNGTDNEHQFFENCADNNIIFKRPNESDNSTPLLLNLSFEGTATPDLDYVALPSQITIPAGEDSLVLAFQVIPDLMNEFSETFIMNIEMEGACSGYSLYMIESFTIEDEPEPFEYDDQNPIYCADTEFSMTPIFEGGSGNFSYLWENGSTSDSLFTEIYNDTSFQVTVTDHCTGLFFTQNINVYEYQTSPMTLEIVDSQNVLPIECLEYAPIDLVVTGGTWLKVFYVETPSYSNYAENIDQIWLDYSSAGTINVTVTDYCFNSVSQSIDIAANIDEMTVNLPDTITYHCGELVTTIADIDYIGDYENTLNYYWSLDNMLLNDATDTCTFDGYMVSQLQLSVTGDCVASGFESATLVMLPFDTTTVQDQYLSACSAFNGCTDSLACNYDSDVIFDDSSCIYAIIPGEITGQLSVGNGSTYDYQYDGNPNVYIYWELINGEILSGQGTPIISVQWDNAGTGVVMATEIISDCIGDVSKIEVLITGVEQLTSHEMRIYPNPTDVILNLEFSEAWRGASFKISDHIGRNIQIGQLNSNKHQIDTSRLSPGVYHLTITSNSGETAMHKFQIN